MASTREFLNSNRFNQLTGRQWAIAAMVAVLAVILRSLFAHRSGFWLDEYYTLDPAMQSIPEMIANRLKSGHSPIYFFYARLFLFFGDSPRILRFSSALMIGLAVLMASGLAGRLRLQRHLPAIWFFALVQPYWCVAGNEFRYMSMVIAFALFVAWVAVHYASSWSWQRGLALAAAFGFLVALHASILFAIPAFVVWLAWEAAAQSGRPFIKQFAKAWPIFLGCLLAYPLLRLLEGNKAQKAPHFPRLDRTLEDLLQLSTGNPFLLPRWLNFNHEIMIGFLTLLLVAAILLCWRQLRREQNLAPWRLFITLFAGVPLFVLLLTSTWREVQGPERYICIISCPALFFFAVAWSGIRNPRMRLLWRGALALVFGVQMMASLLDAGDLHRESVQWLAENNSGNDPIYISTYTMNIRAFNYFNFPYMDQVFGVVIRDARRDQIAEGIRERVGARKRMFFMFYHDKGQQFEAVQDLRASGFIVALREWRVSAESTLLAAITDPSEKPWLDALPAPRRPWGPARGYDKYNPQFGIPSRVRGYY